MLQGFLKPYKERIEYLEHELVEVAIQLEMLTAHVTALRDLQVMTDEARKAHYVGMLRPERSDLLDIEPPRGEEGRTSAENKCSEGVCEFSPTGEIRTGARIYFAPIEDEGFTSEFS